MRLLFSQGLLRILSELNGTVLGVSVSALEATLDSLGASFAFSELFRSLRLSGSPYGHL